jgi:hypothetical protein
MSVTSGHVDYLLKRITELETRVRELEGALNIALLRLKAKRSTYGDSQEILGEHYVMHLPVPDDDRR